MLNDKIMIDIASNQIYYFESIIPTIKKDYPFIKVVDIQISYNESHLSLITIQDTKSKQVGVVFLGSHDAHCWSHDNLNNFLDKSVNQYNEALNYVNKMSELYTITHLSGNSLGGGCAMFVGLHHPNMRALCVNASPVDPIPDYKPDNIIHIRTNSDLLSRLMVINKLKQNHGYPGVMHVVDRSLFGAYNFLETMTLSHRGSITYENNNYSESCLNALPIAKYMSFNLLTNNLDNILVSFTTKQKIHDSFKERIKDVEQGLKRHYIGYLNENLSLPLVSYTKKVNPELRVFLLESILDIDSTNIVTNQVYKAVESLINIPLNKLASRLPKFDDLAYNEDYNKIRSDINHNEQVIDRIIDISSNINEFLLKPRLFQSIEDDIDDLIFDQTLQFKYDYLTLFNDVEKILYEEFVLSNKFIKPAISVIDFTIKVSNLKIIRPFYNNPIMDNDDLEYIKEKYDPHKSIPLIYDACKKDYLEMFLNQSLVYQHQVYLNTINELLELYLTDLNQIRIFNKKFYLRIHRHKINSSLDELELLINRLIEYNKKCIFFN